MDRSSRQKSNKATEIPNDTTEQLDLIEIYRILHPNKAENTYFSSTHGTFFRIDHILGHKTRLNKFKRTEIISSIFSDHNYMKLEINHRKRNEEKNYYMETKQHATKNQWVNNEIKEEIKNILRQQQ